MQRRAAFIPIYNYLIINALMQRWTVFIPIYNY